MSQAIPSSFQSSDRSAGLAPLLLWLAIQLAVLALGAAQVRLTARSIAARESLAADEMLVTQIIAGAMLFPLLNATLRTTVLILVTSIPFTFLAGLLAGSACDRMALACGVTLPWLLALGLLGITRTGAVFLVVELIAAVALSAGLPAVYYLSREFASGAGSMDWLIPLCPTAAAIAAAHGASGGGKWMSSSCALAICLMIALCFRAAPGARDTLSTTDNPQIPTSGA